VQKESRRDAERLFENRSMCAEENHRDNDALDINAEKITIEQSKAAQKLSWKKQEKS